MYIEQESIVKCVCIGIRLLQGCVLALPLMPSNLRFRKTLSFSAARALDMLVLGVCKNIMNTGSPAGGACWNKGNLCHRKSGPNFSDDGWAWNREKVSSRNLCNQKEWHVVIFEVNMKLLGAYPFFGLQNEFWVAINNEWSICIMTLFPKEMSISCNYIQLVTQTQGI